MILIPRVELYHLCNRVPASHYRRRPAGVNHLTVHQGPRPHPRHPYYRTAVGVILFHRLDQDQLPLVGLGPLCVIL